MAGQGNNHVLVIYICSVLFSQDKLVPPSSVDTPMFVYKSSEEDTFGPSAPELEVLAARG